MSPTNSKILCFMNTLKTVQLSIDIITILFGQIINCNTMSIMMIFKLLENPWDCPTCHGHCHNDIDPHKTIKQRQ